MNLGAKMEHLVKSGQPEKQRTACVVVGVHEPRKLSHSAELIDKASDGYISNILRRGDLEGKIGQTLFLHNVPNMLSDRVLLVGCGKEREIDDAKFRRIIQTATKTLNDSGSMEVSSYLPEISVKTRDIAWKIQDATVTSAQSLYRFDEFKSKKTSDRRPLRRLIYMVSNRRELNQCEKAVQIGTAISTGMNLTRNLGNTPPNICKPSYLAETAKNIAKQFKSVSVSILEEKEMADLGMGSLLSVTAGSTSEAKFITLSHSGGDKSQQPIVLVGKGITFDTGGNSLKPSTGMIGMKYDMCGAAAVLGAINTVAELELPLNVIGVIASCENMPGPEATRPDDIVTSMSGQTIEILNTDAEGRLILADALTYCERYNPDVVIDMATLTGAVIVALGYHATGLMSNHSPLANDLLHAGNQAGDRCWQLPIWDDYQGSLKSNFADMSNIATDNSGAGTILAACFLSKFAKKFHWAHLDIAGTASNKKGATGKPIPLLIQYLLNRCK
mgnify:CR=1 FL=1|tara:strand:+ start:198618 stop:200123 length:1506 start_codon:yes stop_codon:yes gene_type:complete